MPSALSKDEARAVAFVGLLLAVSTLARVLDRPSPLPDPGPGVDLAELEAASRRRLDGPARPAAPAVSPASGSRAGPRVPGPAARLDLNRASPEELQRLPGIGAVLAGRIIAYRDSVGGFSRIEQLEDVRGIGPATMRRLAPLIRAGN